MSALDPISSRPSARLRFDQRILLLALAAGFPAALVALILLWTGDYTPKVQWTLTVFIVGVWTGCSFSVRHRVVLPLQTLSNLLAALRESDFSIRARGASRDDALGAVMLEVNVLASTLHDQRLGALEAGALLRTVMMEIDVAVFTFDGAQALRLVNRAGQRLLAQPAEQLLGRTADELGLRPCLEGASPRIEDVAFPGASGRWEVRRTTFRQGGRPHQLLVLADVSRPLRDEERQAWQRLIRVIGHEINNSLTPIKSIAGSLGSMLARDEMRDGCSRSYGASPASRRGCRSGSSRALTSRSAPIPISSSSSSSTSCTTRRTRRWRPAAASPSAGSARAAASSSGSTMRDRAWRMPRTCSCRSSRQSRADPASASSSAARSPKRTAER